MKLLKLFFFTSILFIGYLTYVYSVKGLSGLRNVERNIIHTVTRPVINTAKTYLVKNHFNKRYKTAYGIHPLLEKKINKVIREAKSKGIDLRIVSGFRTFEHQQKLYNKGRTTKGGKVTNAIPGTSYHNYGWAVDVCEYRNGKPYWKSKRWKEIGAIGKKHGLVWGGDWTRLIDKPHLQLSVSDLFFNVLF